MVTDMTTLSVVPSGYIVITAAKEDTLGARWSVASDSADTQRVRTGLQEMISCYEEYKKDCILIQ